MASRELTPEFLEDAANFARQLQQDWDNRFIMGASDILDYYLRFGLNFYVHFRTYAHARPYGEFVACVNSFSGLVADKLRLPGLVNPIDDDPTRLGKKGANEEVMLVPVVELFKSPEGVFLVTGPQTVGLKRFDEFESGRGDALYFPFEDRLVFWGARENGPSYFPRSERFVFIRSDQFEDKVVKRGAEMVYRLTGQDTEFVGDRREVHFLDGDFKPGRISLEISSYLVATRTKKGVDFGAQVRNVFIGPFNLPERSF